jgi:hypothetical protein
MTTTDGMIVVDDDDDRVSSASVRFLPRAILRIGLLLLLLPLLLPDLDDDMVLFYSGSSIDVVPKPEGGVDRRACVESLVYKNRDEVCSLKLFQRVEFGFLFYSCRETHFTYS